MSRTSALLRCTGVAAMAIHPRFEVHQRTFRSSSDVEKDLLRHNAAHQASTARKFGRRLREFSRSAACAGHIESTMRDTALRLEHIASMCVDQSANGAADGGDSSLARAVTSSDRNEANCCMRMRALHHSKSLTLRAR